MKEFETTSTEIERDEGAYLVSGRCIGDTPISVGDFLNGFEVRRIEAYGHELNELPPGMTARLTLARNRS